MKLWLLTVLLVSLQGCALTVSHPRALKPIERMLAMS